MATNQRNHTTAKKKLLGTITSTCLVPYNYCADVLAIFCFVFLFAGNFLIARKRFGLWRSICIHVCYMYNINDVEETEGALECS